MSESVWEVPPGPAVHHLSLAARAGEPRCCRQPQRARASLQSIPAGLLSCLQCQQLFHGSPLGILEAWKHMQAELHLCELPGDSDSPHCNFKASVTSFLLFPHSGRDLHNGCERNAVPWQLGRAISRFCVSAHIYLHTLPFQDSFPAFHFN